MSNKPFPITHAMREKVATELTLQAVAQHGPRIAANLSALNDQFWAQHIAQVEALPGLVKKNWSDLILAGAVTATATCTISYLESRGEDRQPSESEFVAAELHYKNDAHNALVDQLIQSVAFTGVSRYLNKDARYSRSWTIKLANQSGAVPRLNGMSRIADPALEALGLQICSELAGVIQAAKAFRSQAMDVLNACRTSRQVEDLFPEAAKLLPQPVKNEKALAPTELAASVRSMLNKGVPPVTPTTGASA